MKKHKQELIKKAAEYAECFLTKDPAHDWWHTFRVWKTAAKIGKKEGADLFIVEMAALLHDIDDWKIDTKKNKTARLKNTNAWLIKNKVDPESIGLINNIILNISFKGSAIKSKVDSIEAKVVQDADRLDAIGAIGIARAFSYGGKIGRRIFHPKIPVRDVTTDLTKSAGVSTIHHFYDKLLLLKKLMNTPTARSMAARRHKFILLYLKEFYSEWSLR